MVEWIKREWRMALEDHSIDPAFIPLAVVALALVVGGMVLATYIG